MPTRIVVIAVAVACAAAIALSPDPQVTGVVSANDTDTDAAAALRALYENTPEASVLGGRAKGVLVFPSIVKAGFIVGAQYGSGTLFKGTQKAGNYNILAGSYGFQAGAQAFGYAMFMMTDGALEYLDRSGGWEVGVGPSVVVVDSGTAKTLTSTTLQSDVYAFVFDQKGLMAGAGLQGSKITRLR